MILDTCFLIDLMRNNQSAVKKLEELNKKNETFLITSIIIFELYKGLFRCNSHKTERNKIISLLSNQLIISFDEKSAEKAGEIEGYLNEQEIDIPDSMIAGICLVKNEKLLTKNIKHFFKIKDLKIEEY